ncbi:hypothetical protein J3E68DRAFT_321716 [Trichoderma sp. SZMC 28012]
MHRVVETSGQFMYRPAKSMPLNASVPRACASCTPRCLNGPFIVQSPAENPEPNTVGKLEGNTILPLVGMTFSRKGKAMRVFQSQPIGRTLFPGRCRCSALAFELGIGRKKWTHACASSCWFDGTLYSVVYRKGKYVNTTQRCSISASAVRGGAEKSNPPLWPRALRQRSIHNLPTTFLLFPPVRISRIPAVPLLERVHRHPRVCICTCGVSNKGWQGCRRRSAA